MNINFQKILLILVVFTLVMYFAPQTAYAGIVPCGRPDNPNTPENESTDDPNTPENEGVYCTFCHIFVLFKNILDFLFLKIIPALAILMIAIAGAHFLFSGGNPSTLARGKEILKYTAIGLIIIYGAWVIVNLILTFPGLINPKFDWDPSKWFQIDCPIKSP